jgi:AcrR family transcriptional regulator
MLDTPMRDRKHERRTATRAEILDAAWGIAREKGLADLTLREVGSRIGMRAPSLYSYFDSKNAIYDAMFGQASGAFPRILGEMSPRGSLTTTEDA